MISRIFSLYVNSKFLFPTHVEIIHSFLGSFLRKNLFPMYVGVTLNLRQDGSAIWTIPHARGGDSQRAHFVAKRTIPHARGVTLLIQMYSMSEQLFLMCVGVTRVPEFRFA